MSTVRVMCGHIELGKKVVCEGCFNALREEVSRLKAEYEAMKFIEQEHIDARNEMELDRDEWKHRAERMESLVRSGLERMELINGSDEKCVIKEWKQCENHRWIHNAKRALSDGEEGTQA